MDIMSTFLVFLLFALGLALIIKGGDWFVGAAAWIAAVSGIPQFVIGATIVSIATTMPEIIVSAMAASQGSVAMATGNAIGSVTANTGMILAISIIFMPVAIDRKRYLPKSLIFFLAIILLWAFSLSGTLTMIASVVILWCSSSLSERTSMTRKSTRVKDRKPPQRSPEIKRRSSRTLSSSSSALRDWSSARVS